MVDEVQDCSTTDWEIINLISQEYQNLFIVGDPDQAIYEWRGRSRNRSSSSLLRQTSS